MPSAAEQLASNFNLSAFSKATELKQRILFTMLALIVARLGTYIPMPGIDATELARQIQQQQGSLLDVFNLLAGGAIGRMAIFALGIMPYISSSIIIQLMTTVSPTLEQLKKEGEAGRKQINQYTRYGTVMLAAVQAYAIAIGLEQWGTVVIAPGLAFRLSTVITLTGGTIFLMWLGEQITARGVGNGISLIIMAGIVARLPTFLVQVFEQARTGSVNPALLIGMFAAVRGPGRLCRVHGARPAAAARAISKATTGQSRVRRRIFASAAEDQCRGRDSADLRFVAAAAADHGGQFQCRQYSRLAAEHRGACWVTASRCSSSCMRSASSSSAFSTRRSCSIPRRPPTT